MGRPLKRKNFKLVSTGNASTGTITAVSVSHGGSHYSSGITVTVSAPTANGNVVSATVEPVVVQGVIESIAVTNGGIGYLTAPTYTINLPAAVGVSATGTEAESTLTVGNVSGIFVRMTVKDNTGDNAEIPANTVVTAISGTAISISNPLTSSVNGTVTFSDAGSGFVAGSTTISNTTANRVSIQTSIAASGNTILSQVGSRRYRILAQNGTVSNCRLVASASPTAEQCSLVAFDSAGNSYWVTKWLSNKVTIMPNALAAGQTSFQFGSVGHDATARWSYGSAVANVSVRLATEA